MPHPNRRRMHHEYGNILFLAGFIIVLGGIISLIRPEQLGITGFVAAQSVYFEGPVVTMHIFLTFLAFILTLASLYITLNSSERLAPGHFRMYLHWNSLAKVALSIFILAFFFTEVLVFFYRDWAGWAQIIDSIGLLALVVSISLFIKGSLTLKKISRAYGFKKR